MDVYRIVKAPYHQAPHDPLSAIGSTKNGGGRWNPPQTGVLYTATSPALALLETMVHFPRVGYSELPELHQMTIHLADHPEAIFWIDPLQLPSYWRTGTLSETQSIFADWMKNPFSLALAVPSVIMDDSYNIILHPGHPLHETIQIRSIKKLGFDARLWP